MLTQRYDHSFLSDHIICFCKNLQLYSFISIVALGNQTTSRRGMFSVWLYFSVCVCVYVCLCLCVYVYVCVLLERSVFGSERWKMVCAPVRRDNPRSLARGFSTVQAQKCTMIFSVEPAHYGVFCTKDLVSVDCGIQEYL